MQDEQLVRKVDEMMGQLNFEFSIEGLMWPLHIEGVKARRMAVPDPMANFVGLAHFTDETVDEGIERVQDTFAREGVPFSWLVGPTSEPRTLAERLSAHGFQLSEATRYVGMVLEPMEGLPDPPSDVTVRTVPIGESPALYEFAARAFGPPMTPELASLAFRIMGAAAPEETTVYVAHLPGTPDPVGFGIGYFDRDGDVLWLGGAATVPEHRGRGIYSALVARRVADARARGYRAAIIHAMKDTSAPICAKQGFRPVCDIDVYLAPAR